MSDNYPQPIQSSRYTCASCGYDLSGSAIGGSCPECGISVEESIRLGNQKQTGGNSTTATLSLVFGIIGLTACGLLAPFAIWMYYRAEEEVRNGTAPPGSLGMAKAGLITGWIGTIFLIIGCCGGIFIVLAGAA